MLLASYARFFVVSSRCLCWLLPSDPAWIPTFVMGCSDVQCVSHCPTTRNLERSIKSGAKELTKAVASLERHRQFLTAFCELPLLPEAVDPSIVGNVADFEEAARSSD